jgi:hypothetical protein
MPKGAAMHPCKPAGPQSFPVSAAAAQAPADRQAIQARPRKHSVEMHGHMQKVIGVMKLVSETFTMYVKSMIQKFRNYLYTGNKVYLA